MNLAMNVLDILILIGIGITTLIWQEKGGRESGKKKWGEMPSTAVSDQVASVFSDGAGYWTEDVPRTPAKKVLLCSNRAPRLNTRALRLVWVFAVGRGGGAS